VAQVEEKMKNYAPLVFAGEVRTLQEELAKASMGQAFLLMGGDCAEAFDEFSVNHIRDTFRVLLQMSLILTFGGAMPVVKVGRMAGQFAKPRSEPDEVVDGLALPSYRGDIINGEAFTVEARTHNPDRMLQAYHQSAQTLNILRAFSNGGYSDISRLHAWNLDFVQSQPSGSAYRDLAEKVDDSLRFMKAIGVDTRSPTFTSCNFYTAHECLLLPYVFCSTVVLSSFLVCDDVSVSVLSIYYPLLAFSDTTWHESNHHPPRSINRHNTHITFYYLTGTRRA
jgi:3-deoxy-7-phosphoheptulonate synthase